MGKKKQKGQESKKKPSPKDHFGFLDCRVEPDTPTMFRGDLAKRQTEPLRTVDAIKILNDHFVKVPHRRSIISLVESKSLKLISNQPIPLSKFMIKVKKKKKSK